MRLPTTSNHQATTLDDGGNTNTHSKHFAMHTITQPKQDDSSSDDLPQLGVTKVVSPRGKVDGGIQVETVITSRVSRNSRTEYEKSKAKNFDVDDEYPLAASGSDDGIRHMQY
jgi:hypothetical protein